MLLTNQSVHSRQNIFKCVFLFAFFPLFPFFPPPITFELLWQGHLHYAVVSICKSVHGDHQSTKEFFIPKVAGANCSAFQYIANARSSSQPEVYIQVFLCVGHEYPYGIKMSHLRDTVLLTQGSKDSTTPSSLQEPFLMEQLPQEMQCQFILKPSHLAAAQQLSGELLLVFHKHLFQQKFSFLKTKLVQRQRPKFQPNEGFFSWKCAKCF